MKQNLLQIAVTAAPDTAEDTLSAGKMYEHNATALVFILDESLILPEYRYYAEFVTVSGTARTEYLTPDAQNQITVDLPVEVTSQMTALCVFSIVQIGDNGKTEQVIKAKTVRLYFSALENTDRLIDENHAFSVNQLLEAIQQNTFKGDKGDQGDSYVLTSADKAEIAETVNRSYFGLPMYKTVRGTGVFPLPGAADAAAVRSVTVRPCAGGEVLSDVYLCFGENLLSPILDSSKYYVFPRQEAYGRISFTLKPNTAYVLAKRNDTLSKKCSSYVKSGNKTQYFCHTSTKDLNVQQLEFTTDATGTVELGSTGVGISQSNYQTILENEWEGIFLGEKSTSAVLRASFDTPLYTVSADYADCFDFCSGETVRNTVCLSLSADMLDTASVLTLTDGTHTVYRHRILLPTTSQKAIAVTDGFCASYAVTETFITGNAAYKAYVTDTGNTECVFFGTADNSIYVYSEKTQAEFAEMLTEAETAGASLTVLYGLAKADTQTGMAVALPADLRLDTVQICPTNAAAYISYSANITGVFADLEARMQALENRIQ